LVLGKRNFLDFWQSFKSKFIEQCWFELILEETRDSGFFVVFDIVEPDAHDVVLAVVVTDHDADLIGEGFT
jgi:hypothetical protein